jgi:hypothetical protein
MEVFTLLIDLFVLERTTIVSDNGKWDTIPTYEIVKNELGIFFISNICQWNGFNPFHEVFNGGDDEFMVVG